MSLDYRWVYHLLSGIRTVQFLIFVNAKQKKYRRFESLWTSDLLTELNLDLLTGTILESMSIL